MENDDDLSSEEWWLTFFRASKKDQGCFKQNVHTDCKNIGKRRTGKKESLSVVPPKVEYSLTPLGESIVPLIMQIGFWGESLEEKS